MGRLYGRAGRLTTENGGSRPGQRSKRGSRSPTATCPWRGGPGALTKAHRCGRQRSGSHIASAVHARGASLGRLRRRRRGQLLRSTRRTCAAVVCSSSRRTAFAKLLSDHRQPSPAPKLRRCQRAGRRHRTCRKPQCAAATFTTCACGVGRRSGCCKAALLVPAPPTPDTEA